MIFQDNIIKQYLKNVYFITGTPCGGKTTVSRALSKKYGISVYDIDERFEDHQKMSDPEHQPSMNKDFKDADEFFGRSVEEYKTWLLTNTREQLDFVLLDLMRLSQNGPVLCDCHLTLEQADILSDPSRVAFMLKEPKNLVEEYCNRPDHQGFSDFIHSATDYEKAKATCNETLMSLNTKFFAEVKNSRYFWLERDPARSVDETVELVAAHFGFREAKTAETDASSAIEIRKVEKDTELAQKLLSFVENFSWEDVKEHVSGLIREWKFTDWETMFAAVADGKVVGMVSLLKTDYYPLPDFQPWISCLFVDEAYRGHRLSARLIETAERYAKELGFECAFIPSDFTGLYEKYGYTHTNDIRNYGGGMDHLYVKIL